ncbi:hypothetical protein NLU13_4089 [Sarocladium strictum]|uniref:2EXR domain-containing protein n=1 Tax=Sarocladium strictum TaxID=5046 RepID=A0AA39L8L0_SARSR|nr:hypothetical protein NLU13_4089 [Sarocladium strictum]
MDVQLPQNHATNTKRQCSKRRASPVQFDKRLPPEIRLQIWHCSLQPELIFIHDVLQRPQNFILPTVTQINRESRHECKSVFDRVGQGPYFQFPRDIFVCDPSVAEEPPNEFLDTLGLRIQRLAYWDCFPDESAVACPSRLEDSLWNILGRKIAEPIDFDNLRFPNLKELWVIKIGDVDGSWGVIRDRNACRELQFRQLAQQFRYWVKEGILEAAPLDFTDPDTRYLLKNGRCRETICREANHLRPMMVSRVLLMDQPYKQRTPNEATNWVRVEPRKGLVGELQADVEAEARRKRWGLVERVLFFPLRSDCMGSTDNPSEAPSRTRTIGSE